MFAALLAGCATDRNRVDNQEVAPDPVVDNTGATGAQKSTGATGATGANGVDGAAGAQVASVGVAASESGVALRSKLTTGPAEQLTQSLSGAIAPLTGAGNSLTHTLGNTTGLNLPVNGLLVRVGGAGVDLGQQLTAANAPVVSHLGDVVAAAGTGVAGIGARNNEVQPLLGNGSGGLLQSDALGNLPGGSGAGHGAGR